MGIFHQRGLPESECTMLLECGHTAEDSMVLKMRKTPFQFFNHLGTTLMHQSTNVFENWLRECGRPGDIGVDFLLICSHSRLPVLVRLTVHRRGLKLDKADKIVKFESIIKTISSTST